MMTTSQKRYVEAMLPHYLECADWADTPEDAESGLDFSEATKAAALADCERFAIKAWVYIKDCAPEQVAHDFWLTRNHHGTGFWARPEVYKSVNCAELLTEIAQSFGERSIYEHNGRLIIE